jgi:hypothetical protein
MVFPALAREEQDRALVRLNDIRLLRTGAGETQMARCLRSLTRVAECVGHIPGVDEYKQVSAELIATGEDIESFSRLYRYFDTSWARAREALDISETSTSRGVEARFRNRRVGRTWRYTHDALRDAVLAAAEHWGRPPTISEYEWWRYRQIQLAEAAGADEPHLPTYSPFRTRWGGWEETLLHFGLSAEQVAERLQSAGCQGWREFPGCDDGNSPFRGRPVRAGRRAAMASRCRRMR